MKPQIVTLLNSLQSYLQSEEDVLIPFENAWEHVSPGDITREEVVVAIKNDGRFYISEGAEIRSADESGINAATLRQLNYYVGPRIMLKEKLHSSSEVFRTIAKQLKILQDSLAQAYNNKPTHDKDAEKKILEAMEKAKTLEAGLVKIFQTTQQNN